MHRRWRRSSIEVLVEGLPVRGGLRLDEDDGPCPEAGEADPVVPRVELHQDDPTFDGMAFKVGVITPADPDEWRGDALRGYRRRARAIRP